MEKLGNGEKKQPRPWVDARPFTRPGRLGLLLVVSHRLRHGRVRRWRAIAAGRGSASSFVLSRLAPSPGPVLEDFCAHGQRCCASSPSSRDWPRKEGQPGHQEGVGGASGRSEVGWMASRGSAWILSIRPLQLHAYGGVGIRKIRRRGGGRQHARQRTHEWLIGHPFVRLLAGKFLGLYRFPPACKLPPCKPVRTDAGAFGLASRGRSRRATLQSICVRRHIHVPPGVHTGPNGTGGYDERPRAQDKK